MSSGDMYPRPSREEIAASISAGAPAPAVPPPVDGKDVLACFSANVRRHMRARGWSRAELAERCGGHAADVGKAASGSACGLALAGRIAVAFGVPFASLFQQVNCGTCQDAPPAGFRCLECGAETRAA